MEVFVARQPIFNIHEQIVGYELLYRNKHENSFPLVDSDRATIDVLVNSFLSIGIDEVTSGKPAYVNFTENLLHSSVFEYIDETKVVIEILEDVTINDELVKRVGQLKESGFIIALDDFVIEEKTPQLEELIRLADYIKIDFLATSVVKRMAMESYIKSTYPHVKLLAEKVESRNQYDVAKHSGYELFQGYFFEKPQILSTTDIPPNVLQYFQILSQLREEEPNINEIANNIERDISLTYKLLQLINHSNKRTKSKVRSIKQAILLLGLAELRKWMYLLAMRESKIDVNSDVTKELITSSLIRAKLCERLAKYNYEENTSAYYLIGMFSLIDAILQRPLELILQQLPFSEEINETICGKATKMTPYLNLSIAISKGELYSIDEYAKAINIPLPVIMNYFIEATNWVKNSFSFENK